MLLEGLQGLIGVRTGRMRLTLCLLLCLLQAGCGTLYVTQAAVGQWGVLRARRPISAVIADPQTPSPLQGRLSTVEAARDFAVTALHLPDNRSYRTYADIHRPYVVWNVVAAPEFSVVPLRWCFPVAGCVSYRGYFKERRARAFAAKLRNRGLDVAVGGVPAYSTLGKFADPVLSSMMRYGDEELVAIIFHELAHQLLYVKNDTEFNEAFATTVENTGLERWLASRDQVQQMEAFRKDAANERAFVDLFASTRARLARLYRSGAAVPQLRARKAEVLAELATRMRALQQQQGDHDYEAWLSAGLNNAQLASVATYYQCVPGLERLLASQDGDLQRFYAAARELAHRSRAARHERVCSPADPTAAPDTDQLSAAESTQSPDRGAPRAP